jgi:hypothetical protein
VTARTPENRPPRLRDPFRISSSTWTPTTNVIEEAYAYVVRTRKTASCPAAVLKSATELTNQAKMSDIAIHAATTKIVPRPTQRSARRFVGAKWTSSPTARPSAPIARPQRTISRSASSTLSLPPMLRPAVTARTAPATQSVIPIPSPIERPNRCHVERVSSCS